MERNNFFPDHVYSSAAQNLPHLSDHYYQPPAAVTSQAQASRSSTINSIKRMLGLSPNDPETSGNVLAASPLPQFMQFVPAPPQFMSPGTISNDSLMLMSPDYSAVYHPLIVPPHQIQNANFDLLQPRHSGKTQVAESSFSSSSCSSGSTRPPSHNNSTTSTLPVACLSSSSCSCSSSTCQYQRCHQRRHHEEENCEDHHNQQQQQPHQLPPTRNYPFVDPQPRNLNTFAPHPDFIQHEQLAYPMHFGPQLYPHPAPVRRRLESQEENSGIGIFTSLWRKHKSKTSGRTNRNKKTMTTSATTIFRVEPGHPSYPRFTGGQAVTPSMMHKNSLIRHHDGNGNPAEAFNTSLPPMPLSLEVNLGPSATYNNKNQRFPIANNPPVRPVFSHRQHDLINGRSYYGTPTMARTASSCKSASSAHPAQLHGTISNRQRRVQVPRLADNNDDIEISDEESSRLLLMSGDDVWMKMPQVASAATLGKSPRVSGNQGVMPNPDDILPKQAWTDFSGTDDWPNLIAAEADGTVDRQVDGGNVDNNDGDDDDNDVYMNVDSSTTTPLPVPKERKLLKSFPPDPELLQDFASCIESFVDNDDEGVASDGATKSDQNVSSESSKEFDDKDDFGEKVGKNSANLAPRTPAQTFRSTKFINVSSSPRVTSPVKSNPAAR